MLYNIEILRALRFKSSYAFLKRPPGHDMETLSALQALWERNQRFCSAVLA